jgi:hypothetical protein
VYGYGGTVSTRTLARERAGRQRPGEPNAEYAERVADHMPRPSEPLPTDPDAISARNERQQRALKPGTGG